MIIAVYAYGKSTDPLWGDFGSADGRLPWGSFKAELDQFYLTLDFLGNFYDNQAIVVGMTTFKTMPESVKRRIEESLKSKTWIVCSSSLDSKVTITSKNRYIYVVNAVGDSLPTFLESLGISGVLLGGAKLIRRFYELGLIDQAYISVIESKSVKTYPHSNGFSYYPNETTSHILTTLPKVHVPDHKITRVLNATGESVEYKFTQYKEFYY